MDDIKKNYPSLPANYITIADLQKRWAKQQQQQQQLEQQKQEKRETAEEPNHNLKNKDNDSDDVKRSSEFLKLHRPKTNAKPNFATQRPSQGNRNCEKPVKVFRVAERVSDSRVEASGIYVSATREGSGFRELNRFKSDGNPKFVNGRTIVDGRKGLKKVLDGERMICPVLETSAKVGAMAEVESEGLKVGDAKKWKKKIREGRGEKRNQAAEEKGQETLDDHAAEEKGQATPDDKAGEQKGVVTPNDKVAEEKGLVTLDDQTAEVAEEKGQVALDDHAAEIESKLKVVVLSERERRNGRSTAVNEGARTARWGYRRVERRERNKKKWEVKARDEVCLEEIENEGGGVIVGDHGKSTAMVVMGGRRDKRWRRWGVRRDGYNEVCVEEIKNQGGGNVEDDDDDQLSGSGKSTAAAGAGGRGDNRLRWWVERRGMVKKRGDGSGLMWVKKGEKGLSLGVYCG